MPYGFQRPQRIPQPFVPAIDPASTGVLRELLTRYRPENFRPLLYLTRWTCLRQRVLYPPGHATRHTNPQVTMSETAFEWLTALRVSMR